MIEPAAEFDFDPDTPSPLEAIRNLRADARDAVVAVGAQTGAQALAYVTSAVDSAISELASSSPSPHAIFVTGSAGGGKSGAAEHQRQANAGRFSDIVEDATHSDGPSEDQAETLARRLEPLADDSPARPERPILVAANIGMIVQLAEAWQRRGFRYAALTSALFESLGLPGAPVVPDGVAPLDVRVLNLDDRPTVGPGGLLSGILPTLAPAPSGTVFNNTRCASCAAIAYCPARANAALLATVAAAPVDEIAARSAIDRGRQDTPRALWDYLSRAVLPDSHYSAAGDPCIASQNAHRSGDAWWVLTGLLPLTMFGTPGDLGIRVARLDPSRTPSRDAYKAFASAGLVPDDDAKPVLDLLERAREAGRNEPALATAAAALAAGLPDGVEEVRWRDAAARTWLGVEVLLGNLAPQSFEAERPFLDALEIYERWQLVQVADDDIGDLVDDMEDRFGLLVASLARGIARLFGEMLDERTFLPVQNYDPRESSRALVEFELSTATASPALDRPTRANARGARLIGYRPLAVSLELAAGITVDIDLPTYRLLAAAQDGLAGGSGDAERTFALRRAAEAIARFAAETDNVAMLVTDPLSGRRYQVTPQAGLGDRVNLRARAVNE